MLIETRLRRVIADIAALKSEPSFGRRDTGHLQIAEMYVECVLKEYNAPPPQPDHGRPERGFAEDSWDV